MPVRSFSGSCPPWRSPAPSSCANRSSPRRATIQRGCGIPSISTPHARDATRGSTLPCTSGSHRDWNGYRCRGSSFHELRLGKSRAHARATLAAASMNVLTITRQFPNDQQPNYGVFVENRIARLAQDEQLSFRVLAPVAWVPFGRRLQGRRARAGATAGPGGAGAGYIVDYPRYCVIPKLGFPLAPLFMYLGLSRHIRRLMRQGYTFDVI